MPRVVRFHELGGPEKLQIEELPEQQPGPGEVRLRVQAVGLNRAEALYVRGYYLEQPNLPSRIAYEAAGIVEAVGPDVDKSWIGKQVSNVPGFSMNQYGVLAEEAIVPARVLAGYPEKLSSTEAASIWMQYLTAYGALVFYGKVRPGDFVIIPAASSSVGLAAIQIVKAEGGIAIAATRTSAKREQLKSLGADHVIATEEQDLPAIVNEITNGEGARIIFDPVAGPYIEILAQAAAYQGIIFEYGALSLQPTPFPFRAAMQKGLSVIGYTLFQINRDDARLAAAVKYVYDRLADGRFQPKIAKTFPFAETIEAYRYLESNQQIGKVVITIP